MNATPEVIAERRTRFRQLRRAGFNLTTWDKSAGRFRVRCDSCEACCVNGIPCHETYCRRTNHDRR